MTNVPIPPPSEPLVDSEGKINEVWYRYFSVANTAVNAASTVLLSNPVTVAQGGTASTSAGAAVGSLINALSTATPDSTADYLAIYDASATTGAKVLVSDLSGIGSVAAQSLTGTAVDFTGVSTSAKYISVAFNNASKTTQDDILVQLGTTSGVVATGYDSASLSAGGAASGSTSGFRIRINSSALTPGGVMTIWAISSVDYVQSHGSGSNVGASSFATAGGGHVTLAEVADRVRITVTGASSFTGGTARVFWGT